MGEYLGWKEAFSTLLPHRFKTNFEIFFSNLHFLFKESIYCGGGGRSRGDELYYPSSTKSTYCEEDYFLTLSNDRKTFKPIRVCEI